MIRRRTRSHTAPGLALASSKPGTKPSKTNASQNSSRRPKSSSHQSHDFVTPTFTWDIAKVDKQVIYNDLGVKEMKIEGAIDRQQLKVNNNGANQANRTKKQIKVPSSAEVKGQLVSPDQFKPQQPHIHNGHFCSCKKQLQLEKSPDPDPFCCLSDEIMLGIFRWLPMTTLARCARVCKRWSHLVCDDSLWRRIDLSSKTFASGILGQILKRGATAAKLSRCSFQGSVFDDVLAEGQMKVARTTSKATKRSESHSSLKSTLRLQYIDLTATDSQPKQLAEILDRCPDNQIRKLSLESCQVSDDVMKSVAKHGRSLEELNLCMVSGLKEAGLKAMLKNCTKLKSLNLGWANLSRKEMDVFVDYVPESLEKLNLSGCRQLLQTEDVARLACRCPAMKELDLSDATVIDFAAIDSITEHMTQLQHIALSRCYSIPRLSFVQLVTLKQLRAIDIFGLVQETEMLESMQELLSRVKINIYPFSAIARPTTTNKRSNIWEIMCHE